MKNYATSIIASAAVFAVFYACVSFVIWDAGWIQRMPQWGAYDRLVFLVMMIGFPTWIGVGVKLFRT